MNHKNSKASKTTVTYNRTEVEKPTGNLYEAIVIMSKRSRQLNEEIKTELTEKLEEFNVYSENLDEVFENKEQIEVSKQFESSPKPTAIAVNEWLNEGIYFRKPEEEEKDK